jgi:circadian clock protein KaiB
MNADTETSAIITIRHRIRLFVSGNDENSVKARLVITRLCEHYIKDQYELQIVDVLKDYQAAIANQIIVVPTLIVHTSERKTVIVGSLSDESKVINAFDVDNRDARP